MVFALLNFFFCHMWSIVMIVIVMFVFAIILQHVVATHYEEVDTSDEVAMANARDINTHFGNLAEIMITLFASIFGGNDWMLYGQLIRTFHPQFGILYFLIFCFYIIFTFLGVLNVVTGIFVDGAVCTRTEDEVVESFNDDQKRTQEQVRQIFKDADSDKNGLMSFVELSNHLQDPWVRAYFSGIDIDPSEATIISIPMDTDGSGEITIDEFVDGRDECGSKPCEVGVQGIGDE